MYKTEKTYNELIKIYNEHDSLYILYKKVDEEELNEPDEIGGNPDMPIVIKDNNFVLSLPNNMRRRIYTASADVFYKQLNNVVKLLKRVGPSDPSRKQKRVSVKKAMMSGEETLLHRNYTTERDRVGQRYQRAYSYFTIQVEAERGKIGNILSLKYYDVGSGEVNMRQERWVISTGEKIPFTSHWSEYSKEYITSYEERDYADLVSGYWPETMADFI